MQATQAMAIAYDILRAYTGDKTKVKERSEQPNEPFVHAGGMP
jgi:hypothetical protein